MRKKSKKDVKPSFKIDTNALVIIISALALFAIILVTAQVYCYSLQKELDREKIYQPHRINIQKKSTNYKCSDPLVKVSSLKVGDQFNGHVIASISGKLYESPCRANSGVISFDGESVISGTLIRSGGYGYGLLFYPDNKNFVPKFIFNSHNLFDDASLRGLSCTSEDKYNYILLKGSGADGTDFSSQFANSPELLKFLKNSQEEEKFSQKLVLKISNLSIHFSTGGESYNEASLSEVSSVLAESTVSKNYTCADAPIKISSLKSGDIFNSYEIASIDGTLCENNCHEDYSGSINFKDEKVLSGHLSFSEYAGGLFFSPDNSNPIPRILRNPDISVGGLTCGNQSIMISNPEEAEKIIEEKIPGFNNLKKELVTKSEVIYPPTVKIKIKDFKMSVTTGGESGEVASLVEVLR